MSSIAVCSASEINEGGTGHRFRVLFRGEETSAFVIRVEGQLRAYLNRCSHVPVELDWNYGEFLDDSGRMIVCATHGASYDGETGACLGGPCDGEPLVKLEVSESDGQVFWTPSTEVVPHPEGIEE